MKFKCSTTMPCGWCSVAALLAMPFLVAQPVDANLPVTVEAAPSDAENTWVTPLPLDPDSPQTDEEAPAVASPAMEEAETEASVEPQDDLPKLLIPSLEPAEDAIILTLAEAQRQALQDNPALHAAAARIDQARERVRQVQALYYPHVDLSYSATRTQLPRGQVEAARDGALQPIRSTLERSLTSLVFGGTQGGGQSPASQWLSTSQVVAQSLAARDAVDDDISTFQGRLVANYLVFDGFSRRFTKAIAEYGHQETEAAYRESQRLLLSAVAQTYFGVQLARENIAIALADETFNRRLLRDAQARRRVGTGSLSDVLNFEVQIRAARAALLQSQNVYQQARIALATLMGIPEGRLEEDVVIAALPDELPEEMHIPEEDLLVQYAISHRPDLERSELGIARSAAGVRQQQSAYYPRVGAFASKDVQTNSDTRFDRDEVSTTVGLNLSYNLYAGGQRKAAVAEARHLRTEAEHLRAQAEIEVVADVRRALEDLRTTQQQLVLQRTTAEFVERNRNLVEREYEAGQGALARLNQAQRDLIEAQARLALARVSLRLAWQDLDAATGRILETQYGETGLEQEAAPLPEAPAFDAGE